MWWAMLFVSLSVACFGFVYSNRKLKQEKKSERAQRLQDQLDSECRQDARRLEERAQDALVNREIELTTTLECPLCNQWIERRNLWKPKYGALKGMVPRYICGKCWFNKTNHHPIDDSDAERAFPEWEDLAKSLCVKCRRPKAGEDDKQNPLCDEHLGQHFKEKGIQVL